MFPFPVDEIKREESYFNNLNNNIFPEDIYKTCMINLMNSRKGKTLTYQVLNSRHEVVYYVNNLNDWNERGFLIKNLLKTLNPKYQYLDTFAIIVIVENCLKKC